jgi:hypothetical protein
MKIFPIVLLAFQAATLQAAFLKARVGVHQKTNETQALDADLKHSHSLNDAIQGYADSLEPGATKEFLRTLRLCAPCSKYTRIGEDYDGGYIMCSDGLDHGLTTAYSYGINGFDGWGMGIASRYHIPLHEYDCTNFKQPAVCQGCTVHFHPECILNQNGAPRHGFKTMSQQLQESGNSAAADRTLLLKIDVEAAEWDVFAQEPVENFRKFRQIVVEYHWISKTHQHGLYMKAVKKIEQAGFAVTHLHGNNYGGGLQYYGEYAIPNVLEVTYIQKPAAGCAKKCPIPRTAGYA